MPNKDRKTPPEPTSIVSSPASARPTTEVPVSSQNITATEPAAAFLTDSDIYLFNEGTHRRIYEKFGAHPLRIGGKEGTHFAVWAPAASRVSVIGKFNGWNKNLNPLQHHGNSGVWEGFVAGVGHGSIYKYHVVSSLGGHAVDKTDPVGFLQEVAPKTASVVWSLDYNWGDSPWMNQRKERQSLSAPISIYEMHIGSWRRHPNGDSMSYRELAPQLIDYIRLTGFTHVEFLPVMEHPFFGSWGYQVTGFFAASSRYGSPQDLMYLIDQLHQNGIGVILDWVPSHFPTDEHGLAFFDGTHLYEHADPRQGFHPDWGSFIFNYGRNEIRSFLISNAIFWLDQFHADGLRVDAVASMLYLDYSRKSDEWIPNQYGGRDNLEAIDFLRRLNTDVYDSFPDVQMIAEESTAWPMVSRPIYLGGLGFGLKWDMGWMHDTLKYLGHDPIHRKFHHTQLTFRMMYAFTENFLLPLSHDEVVHGKGSLIRKMPGDQWQKFANLRLLFAYLFAQPGKKLLFMGGEFGQDREWNHDKQLDWELLADGRHRGVALLIRDLNQIYRSNPAMHCFDESQEGFEWIDATDIEQSVVTFMRKGRAGEAPVVTVFNFTPIPRSSYRIGVPHYTFWREVLNTDAEVYGGTGEGNMGGVAASPIGYHNQNFSLTLTLPPLSAIYLTPEGQA